MHIVLAHRYEWPQHWVDEADPEYLDELMTFLSAESDHNLLEGAMEPKERERKTKQRLIRRKSELAKQREKDG